MTRGLPPWHELGGSSPGQGGGAAGGGGGRGSITYLLPIASLSVIVLLFLLQSSPVDYSTQRYEVESSMFYDFSTPKQPRHASQTGHKEPPKRGLLHPPATKQSPGAPPPLPPSPKEVEDVVMKEIIERSRRGESQRGKKYRSLVCALSRNDVHLREYVVRNLLAGFSHIVIYDNNQIGKGLDHDTSRMLEPFIRHDLVTVVPWDQDSDASMMDNEKKNGNSRLCLEEYGPLADWVSVMDTDEHFYVGYGDNKGFGGIADLLRDAESRKPDTCAISFPWRMMYGEKRVLKPPGLLMDSYHQVCQITEATKMLFRPEWSNPYNIPHFLLCTNPGGVQFNTDNDDFKEAFPECQPHLVHYYAKSVEEFLTKLEQSIPPYIRYLPDAYNHNKRCPNNFTITYPQEYEVTVRSIMAHLEDMSALGDGGKFLGPLPEFNPGQLDHYDLYMFFKLRVSKGDEWDEAAYLARHADVADWVSKGFWQDGLHQFVSEGFASGRSSCWIRRRRYEAAIDHQQQQQAVKHCIGK